MKKIVLLEFILDKNFYFRTSKFFENPFTKLKMIFKKNL